MQKEFFKSLILLLLSFSALCQDKPKGKFLKDKIKIGEPVEYSLSFKYPSNQEVIFPDSSYAFTPFEFVSKRYFNTVSDSIYSRDSVVYTLSTFEIDSLQHLALPVFLIEDGDSLKVFATPDSIIIAPSLTMLPDSISLMENTAYVPVKQEFNYRYLTFGIVVLVFVAVLFALIFGKKILRNMKISRVRRNHYKFLLSFKELGNDITQENFESKLQIVYSLWKTYLQQLTNTPYTSFSSKEILQLVQEENLKNSLNKIDRGIYAHRFPDGLDGALKTLTEIAQTFYNKKILDLKNGPKE